MKYLSILGKFFKRRLKVVILILSLIVAFYYINQSRYLRKLGYETIPETEIADEYDYVWQGISLRRYGVPIGWTMFDGTYSNPKFGTRTGNVDGFKVIINGEHIDFKKFKEDPRPVVAITQIDWSKGLEHMTFVAPFLDHSPIGGIIYSLGVGSDVTKLDQVKAFDFRKPSLILSLITAILLFVFVFQITAKPLVAALSSAIYSTVPTYIFASRGAYLENVSSLFILSCLVLLLFSIELVKKKKVRLSYFLIFISGVLGGVGILSKEISIGFILGAFLTAFITKVSVKHISTMFLGVITPIIIYALWAFWMQGSLFTSLIFANSVRSDFGSLKFLTIFQSLRFSNFPIDGWWIWGMFSLFIIGSLSKIKENKYLFLSLPVFFAFLTIIFSANSNYPWYWISTIPFIAGVSAMVIFDLFENPKFVNLATFFFMPFSSSFYWGYSVFHQNSNMNLNVYRVLFITIFSVFVAMKYLKFGKYTRYTRYLWFFILTVFLFEAFKWNFRSVQFMVANWGSLPMPSLPRI